MLTAQYGGHSLFLDFIGGSDEEGRKHGIVVLQELMNLVVALPLCDQ
jgi:hypothetical protein